MNKRTRDEYDDRNALQKEGWRVHKPDSVKFNSGSETKAHLATKTAVAYILREKGYRISTEVTNETGDSEIDVVAYAGDGKPFGVEVETDLAREVKLDKIERYVKSNDIIRDCFFLEVLDAPESFSECCEWVSGELF